MATKAILPAIRQAPALPAETNPAQPITATFVANSLRQWWWAFVPAALGLALASATAIMMFFEPVYEASAWIQIAEREPYIAFDTPLESHRFVETQVGLMRSPLILGPVVSKPEVAQMPEILQEEAPIEWLSERIHVKSVGDSELFEVRFEGPNAAHAQLITNEVVNTYLKMRNEDDNAQTQRVIELLEGQKEQRSQNVMRLRENVRELSKQTTGQDPFGPNPVSEVISLEHPLGNLQKRLTEAEVHREVMEARLKVYQEAIHARPVELSQMEVEESVERNVEVQELKTKLATMRVMMLDTERRAADPEKSSTYRKLAGDYKETQASLEEIREELRARVVSEMESHERSVRDDQLLSLQSELDSTRLMEELLSRRYEEELGKVKKSSGQSLELVFALAELEREEKVFELIAARTLALRTEMRAPARVNLLKEAEIPPKPIEALPVKKLGIAMLGSLGLPLLICVFWERTVRRVSEAKQLGQDLKVESVWEIASLPVRSRNARRAGRARGLFEESVDSLRTGLVLSEPLRDARVLAVTSAISREGKTSLSSELAVSIAQATGEPTLLIDGDMRSPDIHTIFEIPMEPGLSKVLDYQCDVQDAIVTDWGEGVHLLPAGRLHKSPHKLLGNASFATILKNLSRIYRYIIIDCPPILPASEAMVIAKAADATLVCAKRDLSRVEQVEAAFERLHVAGARPVGAVLNGVPARSYLYSYGRYALPTA
ncbi:Hypothetical protein PBC10988_35360 [Planctomycetales bacterium 10988]|nr:Hypothetical protein PBC10988_35360 [Planctomycetales bacterium 10988]